MPRQKLLAAAGAAAMVLQPQTALAQSCVSEEEVGAMAIYAVPSAVAAVRLRCAARLAPDGFLATGGQALSDRYAQLRGANWPKAKSGMLKIIAAKAEAGGPLAMLENIPDENIRPIVDTLITQELSPNIPIENCGHIERAMEAVAQIDPAVAGTVLGVIAGLVPLDNPEICEPT